MTSGGEDSPQNASPRTAQRRMTVVQLDSAWVCTRPASPRRRRSSAPVPMTGESEIALLAHNSTRNSGSSRGRPTPLQGTGGRSQRPRRAVLDVADQQRSQVVETCRPAPRTRLRRGYRIHGIGSYAPRDATCASCSAIWGPVAAVRRTPAPGRGGQLPGRDEKVCQGDDHDDRHRLMRIRGKQAYRYLQPKHCGSVTGDPISAAAQRHQGRSRRDINPGFWRWPQPSLLFATVLPACFGVSKAGHDFR